MPAGQEVRLFFLNGYPAIISSFVINTAARFLIGAAKTVVTGLSLWSSGAAMTIVGLGEALITYSLGLLFGPRAKQVPIRRRKFYVATKACHPSNL